MLTQVKFGLFPGTKAAEFSPADLPGLLAWYSADVGVYTDAGSTLATDGQTVQQWNDRSGNNYHLQQTGGTDSRPVYESDGFNSTHGVTFNQTLPYTEYMIADSFAFGAVTTASIFIVMNTGSSFIANNQRIFVYWASGQQFDFNNSGSGVFLYMPSSTTMQGIRNSTSLDSGTVAASTNYRFASIFDGTNHTLYINNASDGSPVSFTASLASPGKICLGAGEDSGSIGAWAGCIVAELIITASAPNAGVRAQIDSYFTTKWGL